MSTPATEGKLPEQPSPVTPAKENSTATFCGRKFERCDCISSKTLYITAVVFGIIFLVLGILGLAGHCTTAPCTTTPLFLQKLNSCLISFATKIGTDPLLLVSFSTAFGVSLLFAGILGLTCTKAAELKEKKNETPA